MRKLLVLLLLWFPFGAVAAECNYEQPVCFGINWNTATISDIDGIDVNARDQYGSTPLHLAVEYNNNPEIISALLKAGADIKARNKNGRTSLHWAAWHSKNPKIISTLLNAGANFKARDALGFTPLHSAATNDYPEIVSILLNAGANVNVRSKYDETPLFWGAKYTSNPQVIETLLEAGGDPKAKDYRGRPVIDHMKENKILSGTDIYWKLSDLSYE